MNSPTYSSTLALEWRAMTPSDEAFVLSSWLRSYAMCPEVLGLPSPVYHELYAPVVRRLVQDGQVMIAHDPELPDTVVGFRVMDGKVLHYVFTKRSFRQMGVATWMLKDLPGEVTYTPQVKYVNASGHEAVWNYGSRLIRDGWRRDPMARWVRRPTNTPEIAA